MDDATQLARLDQWLAANPAPYRLPCDPTADLDEETLRRSKIANLPGWQR